MSLPLSLFAVVTLLSSPAFANWHAVEHGSLMQTSSPSCPLSDSLIAHKSSHPKEFLHGKAAIVGTEVEAMEEELKKSFPVEFGDFASMNQSNFAAATGCANCCPSSQSFLELEEAKASTISCYKEKRAYYKFRKGIYVKDVHLSAGSKHTEIYVSRYSHGSHWIKVVCKGHLCYHAKTFHIWKKDIKRLYIRSWAQNCARVLKITVFDCPKPCPGCTKITEHTHLDFSDARSDGKSVVVTDATDIFPAVSTNPIKLTDTEVLVKGVRNGQTNSLNNAVVSLIRDGIRPDSDLRDAVDEEGNSLEGTYIVTVRDSDNGKDEPNALSNDPKSTDWRFGGTVTFKFPCAVSIESIQIVDIDPDEDEFANIEFFGASVQTMSTRIPGFRVGNMMAKTFEFGATNIDKLKVTFSSSGAVGKIKIGCACPNKNK
mmetsp:Transcript_14558/g.17472  ORF Transcript_14558/g.17472 Transcript_14558/m.17472 type:complete len:429 (-) Transcript_14558:309-1595(-)